MWCDTFVNTQHMSVGNSQVEMIFFCCCCVQCMCDWHLANGKLNSLTRSDNTYVTSCIVDKMWSTYSEEIGQSYEMPI